MSKHYFKIILTSLMLMPTLLAEEVKVHTYERVTPWGVTVAKHSYYLKKGKPVQHGDDLDYYEDGHLYSKTSYRHGEPHGHASLYYKHNKRKLSESTYVNGEQHGPERHWSAEGKLVFECEWKSGKPWNGRAASESSSGTGTINSSETWTTYLYKNGKKTRGSKKVFTSNYHHQTPDQKPD